MSFQDLKTFSLVYQNLKQKYEKILTLQPLTRRKQLLSRNTEVLLFPQDIGLSR